MRWLLTTLILVILVTPAVAREVWSDGEFRLQTAGWATHEMISDWTGVKLLLTMPEDGWMLLEGEGALELFFPKFGWRSDIGIIIIHGCEPNMNSGRDTKGGACGINAGFACDKRGGKVMMVARFRRFFPTSDNKPTRARWVTRRAHYGTD